jgi:hypothetical protein
VPVPPGFRQVCPTAISTRTRHPRRVAPTKLQWRSTCTGQRTKRRTRLCRFVRGMTLLTPVHGLRRAHADVVPFLGALWTSAVAGASPAGEEPRCQRQTDRDLRSDGIPRRTPPSRRPGCLSTVTTAKALRLGSLRADSLAPVSRSRRPHVLHWGEVPSRALQAPRCGHPRSVVFERRVAFVTSWTSTCLGLTTQARQRGSDDVTVRGD